MNCYDLWFDPEHNKFTDGDGNIIFDIFRYISPVIFELFLERKTHMIVQSEPNVIVELFYPYDDEEQDDFVYYF